MATERRVLFEWLEILWIDFRISNGIYSAIRNSRTILNRYYEQTVTYFFKIQIVEQTLKYDIFIFGLIF